MKQVAFHLPTIPGIEGAIYNVLDHQAKHGTEMFIALRPDGSTAAFGHGSETRVAVSPEAKGCFLVHNHPGDACPLSLDDMKVISSRRMYGNLCCSADGSIAWTCGTLERNPYISQGLLEEYGFPPHTYRLGEACASKYGERGLTAMSWVVLDNLIRSDILINLYVKTGTDFSGYDLAVSQGIRLLPTFGFVTE